MFFFGRYGRYKFVLGADKIFVLHTDPINITLFHVCQHIVRSSQKLYETNERIRCLSMPLKVMKNTYLRITPVCNLCGSEWIIAVRTGKIHSGPCKKNNK